MPNPTGINQVGPPKALRDRFVEKYVVQESGCWRWTRNLDRSGYGLIRTGRRMALAHRVAYELFVGTPPPLLDHLCNNRWCVNPTHLVPNTHRGNVMRGDGPTARNARKTHCDAGHPFDADNTYVRPGGRGRSCRACNRAHVRAYEQRQRPA